MFFRGLLVIAMFSGFVSTSLACEAGDMVGRWRCNGACTPGEDVAEFSRNDDGSFRWVDGKGNVGTAQVGNVNITISFPNGSQYSGVLRAGCRQIEWHEGQWYEKQ